MKVKKKTILTNWTINNEKILSLANLTWGPTPTYFNIVKQSSQKILEDYLRQLSQLFLDDYLRQCLTAVLHNLRQLIFQTSMTHQQQQQTNQSVLT